MTRCDVVIITWNDEPSMLRTAVDSALEQSGVDVRVIVLDNGSETPVSLERDERLTVIRSAMNRGVGGGRNLGCAHTDAEYLCLLDSDARLHPDALSRLVEPLLADPSIALTAPVFARQLPEASAGRAPSVTRKLQRALNRTDVYARTPGQGIGPWWEVDFAIGACQVARSSAFEAVGGLDDSAQFGPEDVDFCLRLREAGWRVLQVAHAGCDHPPRRAFKGLATARGLRHSVAVVRHLWRHRAAVR